jgi:hypothetical protein
MNYAKENGKGGNLDRNSVTDYWLGVEDDLRTLPPRLMEEIAALSVSRIGEP